jgi:hypothetical protein
MEIPTKSLHVSALAPLNSFFDIVALSNHIICHLMVKKLEEKNSLCNKFYTRQVLHVQLSEWLWHMSEQSLGDGAVVVVGSSILAIPAN